MAYHLDPPLNYERDYGSTQDRQTALLSDLAAVSMWLSSAAPTGLGSDWQHVTNMDIRTLKRHDIYHMHANVVGWADTVHYTLHAQSMHYTYRLIHSHQLGCIRFEVER